MKMQNNMNFSNYCFAEIRKLHPEIKTVYPCSFALRSSTLAPPGQRSRSDISFVSGQIDRFGAVRSQHRTKAALLLHRPDYFAFAEKFWAACSTKVIHYKTLQYLAGSFLIGSAQCSRHRRRISLARRAYPDISVASFTVLGTRPAT